MLNYSKSLPSRSVTVSSDSYNYTFQSMGSIGAIVLLNYIILPSLEKQSAIYFHYASLFGIVVINIKYFNNFNFTRIFTPELTTIESFSFGVK